MRAIVARHLWMPRPWGGTIYASVCLATLAGIQTWRQHLKERRLLAHATTRQGRRPETHRVRRNSNNLGNKLPRLSGLYHTRYAWPRWLCRVCVCVSRSRRRRTVGSPDHRSEEGGVCVHRPAHPHPGAPRRVCLKWCLQAKTRNRPPHDDVKQGTSMFDGASIQHAHTVRRTRRSTTLVTFSSPKRETHKPLQNHSSTHFSQNL